jgi:hypothetical protein
MAVKEGTAIADNPGTSVDEEQKREMIANLAYSYAEKRGFEGGDPTEDWLRAESAIKQRLADEQESRVY